MRRRDEWFGMSTPPDTAEGKRRVTTGPTRMTESAKAIKTAIAARERSVTDGKAATGYSDLGAIHEELMVLGSKPADELLKLNLEFSALRPPPHASRTLATAQCSSAHRAGQLVTVRR